MQKSVGSNFSCWGPLGVRSRIKIICLHQNYSLEIFMYLSSLEIFLSDFDVNICLHQNYFVPFKSRPIDDVDAILNSLLLH